MKNQNMLLNNGDYQQSLYLTLWVQNWSDLFFIVTIVVIQTFNYRYQKSVYASQQWWQWKTNLIFLRQSIA